MQVAHYNNGNNEDAVRFHFLTGDDVANANAADYMGYLDNVTRLQSFIRGLFKYSLYEEGWDTVDDSKFVKLENSDQSMVQGCNKCLFEFFMQQLGLSIEAEQKARDLFQWGDPEMGQKVLASIRHIVIPDYHRWKQQMEEHYK